MKCDHCLRRVDNQRPWSRIVSSITPVCKNTREIETAINVLSEDGPECMLEAACRVMEMAVGAKTYFGLTRLPCIAIAA
jgi:hypothetical protein